ncbi:Neutral ceramidase [Balamuthia mandrillaris]
MKVVAVVALVVLGALALAGHAAEWQIGAGIYDITGPASEIGMMGYAMPNQRTSGIHFRLRARAFVIVQGDKRVAFVSTDSAMIYTSVKREVVKKLQATYGNMYDYDNVVLSGTHTHSGPGGYSEYAIFDITTLGFQKDNWKAIIDGIYQAIVRAHNSVKPNASILFANGTLMDSNINRSPTAYKNNPAAERAKYQYDVDKVMNLLKFVDGNGKGIGMANWFSVHGTSMNNTNRYISGDNKGYASLVFERQVNGNDSLPGTGPFVAAFGQTAEGDVSPNTKGAFCNDGTPCEVAHSTCGGYSEGCHGYGPGKNNDNFENTKIIGGNQFKKAWELYNSASLPVTGPLHYVHTFVNMEQVKVGAPFNHGYSNATTCPSALGDSFASGTTDGPGEFNFVQGTNSTSTNPYWNFIGSFLSKPSKEQMACQYPKPILLNTGGIQFPAPWEPSILPLQLVRLGQVVLIAVPGEFSTMSGRRLRDTVKSVVEANGMQDAIPIIVGLANAYSHYITTFEEYHIQRYEGASTLYGPHTLGAYQQEYSKLAVALAKGTTVPPGPTPPDLSNKTFCLQPGVIEDVVPPFTSFGDVHVDVKSSYRRGLSTAKVVFWGADLRNNYMTEKSFLTVERQVSPNNWQVVATDGSWETKFKWESYFVLASLVTVEWEIPEDAALGTYRIRTYGAAKVFGNIKPFTGTSSTFTVTA